MSVQLFKATTNSMPAVEKVYHITAASHRRHFVSNHRHINRLLNSLFSSTSKKTSKLQVTILLWGESTSKDCWPLIPFTNGPVMWKSVLSWRHHELTDVVILNQVCILYHSVSTGKLFSFWTTYINIYRFPYQNSITLGCKLKLLL